MYFNIYSNDTLGMQPINWKLQPLIQREHQKEFQYVPILEAHRATLLGWRERRTSLKLRPLFRLQLHLEPSPQLRAPASRFLSMPADLPTTASSH